METATDIQRLAFAPIARGRDVFGRSRTGTGKSIAFLLPALQRFASYRDDVRDGDVSIVVVSPIKELSLQLAEVARSLTRGFAGAGGSRPFRVCTVIGKTGAAEFAAGKAPCDMLVATPGVASASKGGGLAKLLMTDARAARRLHNVRTMVLDEGDELTSGGFLGAVREIDSHVRRQSDKTKSGKERYQMLVFSATLPPELSSSKMMKPRMADVFHADTVGHGHKAVGAQVAQEVVVGDSRHLTAILVAVVRRHVAGLAGGARSSGGSDPEFQRALAAKLAATPDRFSDLVQDPVLLAAVRGLRKPGRAEAAQAPAPGPAWKVLVFVSSALYVDYTHEALAAALPAARVLKIHGKMTPGARSKASDAFRTCTGCVLVSTDASARGMDYDGITAVVQVGFTGRSEFLQRAGRVGRAGRKGYAAAVLDTAEAARALRKACSPTDEMCIGDMVDSGAVLALGASPDPAARGDPSALHYSQGPAFRPSKAVNPRRVFATWLGGVASNFKRLKIPPPQAVDWALRFAEGLGVPADEKSVRAKLNLT